MLVNDFVQSLGDSKLGSDIPPGLGLVVAERNRRIAAMLQALAKPSLQEHGQALVEESDLAEDLLDEDLHDSAVLRDLIKGEQVAGFCEVLKAFI